MTTKISAPKTFKNSKKYFVYKIHFHCLKHSVRREVGDANLAECISMK